MPIEVMIPNTKKLFMPSGKFPVCAMPLIANTRTNVPTNSARKLLGTQRMLGAVQKQARFTMPSSVAMKCL